MDLETGRVSVLLVCTVVGGVLLGIVLAWALLWALRTEAPRRSRERMDWGQVRHQVLLERQWKRK